VHLAHEVGVALGQVVVGRDHVGAPPGERVQEHGQRGHQRLALARGHLRQPALRQRQPAHQLHVVVAQLEHPPGGLAHQGERLLRHGVQRRAARHARPQGRRPLLQGVIREGFNLRLKGIDFLNPCIILVNKLCITNIFLY